MTGVQTCALPIFLRRRAGAARRGVARAPTPTPSFGKFQKRRPLLSPRPLSISNYDILELHTLNPTLSLTRLD